MLADLVEITPALEAFGIGVDQHQRRALGALCGIGLGDNDDHIGVLAIGDVGLGPVHHEMVAVLDRGGADALQVAARPRLGHGDGRDDVARHHAGQVFLPLFLGAEPLDVIGSDVVLQREPRRAAEIRQLFAEHTIEAEIEAEPAILFLDRRAQHPRLAQRFPGTARHDAFLLVLVEKGGHVLGKDLAHGVAEGLVVFVICGAITGIEHVPSLLSYPGNRRAAGGSALRLPP